MPRNEIAEKVVNSLLDPNTPMLDLVKHFTQWTEETYGPGIDRAVQLRAASQIQRSVDTLKSSVDVLSSELVKAAASSKQLGDRLWWLNLILVVATAVIAAVAVTQLYIPAPV